MKWRKKNENYNIWNYRIKNKSYNVWNYKINDENYNILNDIKWENKIIIIEIID